MRTIVFSDAHGEPDVIRRVLTHSGYRPGDDRLVFAGDAIEVGAHSWECLELLEELGAEVLVGNHEIAVWYGHPLEPESLDAHVQAAVVRNIDAGRWKVAAVAGGVLITHGGVSNAFADELGAGMNGDTDHLADQLNRELELAVALGSDSCTCDALEEGGPLWYRPSEDLPPLGGVMQLAGHTPPELLWADGAAASWAKKGLFLIDPYVRRWVGRGHPAPAPVRYAVIENSRVTVFEDGI